VVLIGLDSDGRHEIRVANERYDAPVAFDDEDRALGERAREKPAVVLVVLDALGMNPPRSAGDVAVAAAGAGGAALRSGPAAATSRRRFGSGEQPARTA
jgi:hypothetical protein